MKKYRPAFLMNPCIAILTGFIFFIPMFLLILMSIFRNQLANIDKMIATYMRCGAKDTQPDNTCANPLPFNTGFIYYLNVTESAVVIIPILYTGAILGIFWAATRTKSLLPYLYVLVAAVVYVGLSNLTSLILKVILNRPRPRQIAEYSTDPDMKNSKVTFMPVFSRYTGENPLGLKLHSTPSGHTMIMASSLFPLPILTYLLTQMYIQFSNGGHASGTGAQDRLKYVLWLVFFYLCVAVTAVFAILMPPLMAYARYTASAHFFTDTIVSILLAFLHLVLIFISIPDLSYIESTPAIAVCKDGSERDTHHSISVTNLTSNINSLPP